jgi:phage antirepressor YoqD-like protein
VWDKNMNRLQEWILFFLLDREKNGLVTKGRDLFWPTDVQPLVEMGMIEIEQTNVIPSLQKSITASTIVRVTEKGRQYFEK